jgi:hypothetical protein
MGRLKKIIIIEERRSPTVKENSIESLAIKKCLAIKKKGLTFVYVCIREAGHEAHPPYL